MQDLNNNIKLVPILGSAVRTADANGDGVDLKGFEAAICVDSGAEGVTLSSSVKIEFELEHSDDNSTFTDVAQADVIGATLGSNGLFLTLDDNAESPQISRNRLCRWKKICACCC